MNLSTRQNQTQRQRTDLCLPKGKGDWKKGLEGWGQQMQANI